jgi:hypothetical protein
MKYDRDSLPATSRHRVIATPPLRSAAVAAAVEEGSPVAVSCGNRALWHPWDRKQLQMVMPIVPRAVVEKPRRRVPQRFSKRLLAVAIQEKTKVLPRAKHHRAAKKQGGIAQRHFRRFPPADTAGNRRQTLLILPICRCVAHLDSLCTVALLERCRLPDRIRVTPFCAIDSKETFCAWAILCSRRR